MRLNKIIFKLFIASVSASLIGCSAGGNNPGSEYSPNMYHPVAYEPFTQVIDEDAGNWLSNRGDGKGEFYGRNSYNPFGMSMRLPVKGTIKRTSYAGNLPFVEGSEGELMIYRIHKDSTELAGRLLKNPLQPTEAVLAEGQTLYLSFCSACHGETGQGDGKVGAVYKGVPSYNKGRYVTLPEGHIYHTITNGKGRMWPHGSQINPADRWKIVHYVQTLQKL